MKINELGRTGIKVSRICLGTMTFGEQNTEDESHRQLDMAYEHGVNFFDTAETYSFPGRPETQGNSERIIGTWMKARKNRNKVIIATKIAGPSAERSHIRSGILKFTREQVAAGIKMLLANAKVKAILVVTMGGGVLRCDTIAEGIVAAVKETHLTLPLVVRLEGNNVDAGRATLAASGLTLITAESLSEGAEKSVAAVK